MNYKIIDFDEFVEYFQGKEQESGLGIEFDPDMNDNYLFYQTFLPKNIIPTSLENSFGLNPFNSMMQRAAKLPDKLFFKFELFGQCTINGNSAFVFKPWVINMPNEIVARDLESFHLFLPSFFIEYLINQHIFLEAYQWRNIRNTRVLTDLNLGYEDLDNDDFSPFEKIRTKNLYELDNNFRKSLKGQELNIKLSDKAHRKFKHYFY